MSPHTLIKITMHFTLYKCIILIIPTYILNSGYHGDWEKGVEGC